MASKFRMKPSEFDIEFARRVCILGIRMLQMTFLRLQ